MLSAAVVIGTLRVKGWYLNNQCQLKEFFFISGYHFHTFIVLSSLLWRKNLDFVERCHNIKDNVGT